MKLFHNLTGKQLWKVLLSMFNKVGLRKLGSQMPEKYQPTEVPIKDCGPQQPSGHRYIYICYEQIRLFLRGFRPLCMHLSIVRQWTYNPMDLVHVGPW